MYTTETTFGTLITCCGLYFFQFDKSLSADIHWVFGPFSALSVMVNAPSPHLPSTDCRPGIIVNSKFVMGDREELKIVTFNTNDLGEFKKKKDVFDLLRKQSANLKKKKKMKTGAENVIRSQWGFDYIVAGPDCASKRVAILFKNYFEYKIHNILKDDQRRYIMIDIEMLNKRLTLANLYAPSSGDHLEFFDKVVNEVVSMDTTGGDCHWG